MRVLGDSPLLVPGARFGVIWRRRDEVRAAAGGVPGDYQPRSQRRVFVETSPGRCDGCWYRTAHADSGDLLSPDDGGAA